MKEIPFLPPLQHVLQYFKYRHLPPHLQPMSSRFGDLAAYVANQAPHSPETVVAVRKLLEAKDAAVRALIDNSGDN